MDKVIEYSDSLYHIYNKQKRSGSENEIFDERWYRTAFEE
jgi:hypothetical protein